MPTKEEYSALRRELEDLWKYCRSLHYIGFAFILSLNYLILKPILDSTDSSSGDRDYPLFFALAIAVALFGQLAALALLWLHKSYMSAIFRLGGYTTIFHDYYQSPEAEGRDYGWHFWNRVEASCDVRNSVYSHRKLRMVFVPIAFGPFQVLLSLSVLPLMGLFVFAFLEEELPQLIALKKHLWACLILWLIMAIIWWKTGRAQTELNQETERWVAIWSRIRNNPQHAEKMKSVIEGRSPATPPNSV